MTLHRSKFTATWLAIASICCLPACNQLERVVGGGGPGDSAVPAEVRAAFERSCANSTSCHAGGGIGPAMDGASIDLLVGTEFINIGDIPGSKIAVKMLSDAVLDNLGVMRVGARMPLGFDPAAGSIDTFDDMQTILAWISGADFIGGEDPTDSTDPTDPTDDPTDPTGEPLAPTFANVQAEIFAKTCSCHLLDPPLGALSLEASMAYDNIVGVPSVVFTSMNLITPNDLDNSYLYRKVINTHLDLDAGNGDSMPPGAPLSDELVQLLAEWIEAGAPND